MGICRNCKSAFTRRELSQDFCDSKCYHDYMEIETYTCEWDGCEAEVYGRPVTWMGKEIRLCGLHMLLVP